MEDRGLEELSIEHRLEELDEKKQLFQKKKKEFDELLDYWAHLERKEEHLLEEIHYLSQGTHAASHAVNQLNNWQEEALRDHQLFSSASEEFNNHFKKIENEKNFLQEERKRCEKEDEQK